MYIALMGCAQQGSSTPLSAAIDGGSLIDAHDVAIMMALLKIARTKLGKRTSDTYIDASAYMAIAGEIEAVTEKEDEEFKIDLMKGKPER